MTGEFRKLDPRFVAAQQVVGWSVFAAVIGTLAVLFGLAWWTGEQGLRWLLWTLGLLAATVAPILIWLAAVWPGLAYRHYAYRIDESGIEIVSGAIFRRVTSVPRSRVQHTDVSQGPIERRFGLGTLVIYTAGTQFARVSLPGLEHGIAVWTRDTLLPRDGADAV